MQIIDKKREYVHTKLDIIYVFGYTYRFTNLTCTMVTRKIIRVPSPLGAQLHTLDWKETYLVRLYNFYRDPDIYITTLGRVTETRFVIFKVKTAVTVLQNFPRSTTDE